jgi:hypothetical protein
MTVYVVRVIFSDLFYLVLSISRGAMLRWLRRTGWRLSKSVQGNRRGVSHETRCRIKDSKGGESHSCSRIFSRINLVAQGAKVRASYIAFAHQEKKRLEGDVQKLAEEIKVQEKEVSRLRGE